MYSLLISIITISMVYGAVYDRIIKTQVGNSRYCLTVGTRQNYQYGFPSYQRNAFWGMNI